MEVREVEPHDFLLSCQQYTFRCTGCGETEQRLLSRERNVADEILMSVKIERSSALLKPHEKIPWREDQGLGRPEFSNLRQNTPAAPHGCHRVNELMKDPKHFIAKFVRSWDQTSQPEQKNASVHAVLDPAPDVECTNSFDPKSLEQPNRLADSPPSSPNEVERIDASPVLTVYWPDDR